jgi:hypothetical protein
VANLKPYLQLVRLPNLFTAVADSLAGWLLVESSLHSPGRWLPLALASLATYAGGIVLNDVLDYEVDRKERPARPLPSGRVNRRFAAVFGSACLVLGLLLAAAGSPRAVVVEVVLIVAVLAYDLGLKRTLLGPEVMGACRGLNLLLGLSASANLGGPAGWIAAASYATFVAGITWISRSEVDPVSVTAPGRAVGVILQNLAFLGYLAVAVHPESFSPSSPAPIAFRAAGIALLLALAVVVNRKSVLTLRATDPAVVQKAVKVGILSLVWLHVGLLLAVHGPIAALSVAWLWFPAVVAGRWVYST